MAKLYAILMTVVPLLLAPILIVLAALDTWHLRRRLQTSPAVTGDPSQPLVWFHAASLGEVVGLKALVEAFRASYPDFRIAISTTTLTGLEHAKSSVQDPDALFLLPLDIPVLMNRILHHLQPAMLVLLEGELWPSMIAASKRYGCPIALVNARMSDRSYPRNKWVRPLFTDMLSKVDVAGAQTRIDADRLIAFGLPAERVTVTGNLKSDPAADACQRTRSELRRSLFLNDNTPVFIAGCPRPVEEEKEVLLACEALVNKKPDMKIIWAPRHLDRLPDAERMLSAAGLTWIRRTALRQDGDQSATVILVDTIGELSDLYGAADVAFVGATLVPLGGHNLLEPASHGVPVLFGPNYQNVRESALALLGSGGGREIRDGGELARVSLELLEDVALRKGMGAAASAAVASGDGALEATLDILQRCGIRR